MIKLQRKLLLLCVCVCVLAILMIKISAFACCGKSGKGGEPGSGCQLPEGYTDFKFSGTPYEGILELECETDQGQCVLIDCTDPELRGKKCVSLHLFGSITQVGKIECSGYIPHDYPYYMGEMEESAFENYKSSDMRGCLQNIGYWGEDYEYHPWFDCADQGAYFNVYDAGKVRYSPDRTRITGTVKVKELIPIN